MSAGLHLFSHVLVLFLAFCVHAGAEDGRRVYVVYMGAGHPAASPGSLEQQHLQLLASVVSKTRADKALVRSYRYGFSGFAAKLSKEEALAVSKKPGVVSVFADPVLQLHTTRSWDFLRQSSVETDSRPASEDGAPVAGGTADTIIGLLDTGIWPESESFNDRGMGEIPAQWKGKCEEAQDFKPSNCNRKLIGARSYDGPTAEPAASVSVQSPRDTIGHGTHTASTAAGSPVSGASYYGLAAGVAKGGSTSSRLAMYKVCGPFGCAGSKILAGFDDAIGDGVDVLSLSLGASSLQIPDFATDPIAIGSFHAVTKGITVVCSAGNSGPNSGTVVNGAPWILTVAATTIDRNFESDVVLGGANTSAIKGEAINFSNLSKSAIYPLISGQSAESKTKSKEYSARFCDPYVLDADKVKGKIVLCDHPQRAIVPRKAKIGALRSFGAAGMIMIDDEDKAVASNYLSFPATVVSAQGGAEIFSYINSTENPVATILPSITVNKYNPAPMKLMEVLLLVGNPQPDVAAPGVNILAAWPPLNDSSSVPPGKNPTSFNLISGTSMSCPHVSGVAAAIKSWNPTWSPSAIRSAIMTTATHKNNAQGALTLDSGEPATPYDYGAGEVSPMAALRPGLVYETDTEDYLLFLCNYGYNTTTIKRISSSLPDVFECPRNASAAAISDLNYPSIAVSGFEGEGSRTVNRALTNVGEEEEETVYLPSVESPAELTVKVTPERLQFTKNSKKVAYQVAFSAAAASSSLDGDFFGSITWSNGKYKVRTPFVVSSYRRRAASIRIIRGA
ncbi:hypothetical protein Taro_037409 [Colocasia esculenta]|uniref:CO(2)-response secreted protease n=1 Tax=Colocasia esculenta TaxID=4460 RepID=A0A843WB15_COLES|nr:hypothetical protein [Colocasia esculenta]